MSPQVVAAIIAASVSFLTLIGTLAAQYFGRRATSRDTQKALEEQGKQLDRTLAEQRTGTLNERFATAASQLGSDKSPTVRLAGVYAMAGLADDWPENRQTCVDVLCAYLRMPYEPDPGNEAPEPERLAFRASREVRHTVIRVITAHLREGAGASWQGLTFDLTGVVFDGGDFTGAKFSGGTVSFAAAEFSSGRIDFHHAEFSGGRVDFRSAEFSGGRVDLRRAEFSGGLVDFRSAEFSAGRVDFDDAKFSGGTVDFWGHFSGGMVTFNDAEFSGGTVSFNAEIFDGCIVSFGYAEFSGSEASLGVVLSDGTFNFRRAKFSGSKIDFHGAEFYAGEADFSQAKFSGGTVDFDAAKFSGSRIDFEGAEFSGATVDFSNPGDWSVPPEFPWTGPPPKGVILPKDEDQPRA